MDFYTVLDQAIDLLRRRGRVTYRALQLQLQLDADTLAVLKEEIIKAQRLAVDEGGEVLVWTGGSGTSATPGPSALQSVPPLALQAAQAAPTGVPSVAPRPPDAERRQLTVLFCDLVDSTRLAGQLDPEEWRTVVRAYQETCATVIQRFDGYIAQYLGDGVLVYFGYPQAHEDDAPRGVHTGMGLLQAVQGLNTRLGAEKGLQLTVRVGIHTGLVVVGEVGGGGRHEQLALGDTPNIAARLQGLAAPATVVMSAATHQLVQGLFTCELLGVHTLKGVVQPLAVYQVLGASAAQSRFEVAVTTGLTPLVGREEEVRLLRRRWEQVKEGDGQVVLLSGEAGIGKSRLVQELREWVAQEGATRMALRCSPYHQNSALYPVLDHLQQVLHFRHDETPETKLEKLERVLRTYRFARQEVMPLFAALLSLPHPEGYPPLHLTPQRQRQKIHEALVAWLLEEVERQPVLTVWEDLHWADPSTLELLGLLVGQPQPARMLTVLTCRPEFRPPWGSHSQLTQLTLIRFTRRQVEEMVLRITGGKPLPAEVVQQIVAKTDGVPLFVEELTKVVLESGWLREGEDRYELTGPLPPLAIPATLHDSLMARLDRLATVKAVAQLGAAIGRTFAYELVRAVAPLDEATLQHGLRQLVEAELVYQRGEPPQAIYTFKHALIQDAAYQSLLRSTRQQYHQRIAQVLEAQFPETAATQPELLAHHYTEAGLLAQAIPYWQRAGERAMQRSAHVEAIGHLTRELEMLHTLPGTPERAQQELRLQMTLGTALVVTKGVASLDVEQVYSRAQELCQQVGETPQLSLVLRGLGRFYLNRAELQTARELFEQSLSIAQRQQDLAHLLGAHVGLGITLVRLGELVSGRAHLEHGEGGGEAGVPGRMYAAQALWLLGYPNQALESNQGALTLARELARPNLLANTLIYAATLYQFRREKSLTQELAEAVISLSTEQGFPQWLAMGTLLQGWALAEQGRREEGIGQMQQGLDAYRATGAEVFRPYYLALLAEAHGNVRQTKEGLSLLGEALETVHKSGGRWWEAELYRLEGELLLKQKAKMESEAEERFQQALEVARQQQAKSLELRAATSLSRLWQQQGRRDEARRLLAEVYGWFTEGFDTADLQEARVLLEELHG
jgi:class 3 adenylate cyclase/tetratricopeptide (TPR) repeat protein